jgi:hypothetical protein
MKRILMLIGLLAVVSLSVNAQDGNRSTRLIRGLEIKKAVEAARFGASQASPEVLARVRKAFRDKGGVFNPDQKLVGTWNVVVPGEPPFNALQTFHSDGTFTETSSLLATLTEGPAHGVWEYRRRGATLTFELFAFDADGNQAGRIRVRGAIQMIDEDNFAADVAIDFIELDGTEVPEIATGSFTASRLKLRGL